MEPTNETALISDTETAREKFEQARLSRRTALRKMGLTTGMALFGMFAVDDLARIAIKKMEEQKQLHEVGETVAKEFKNSGIAFADATGSSSVVADCTPEGGCVCKDCTSTCACQQIDCDNKCGNGMFAFICKGGCGSTQRGCVANCPPADGSV